MMLLPLRMSELAMGGERMEMSMAVPLRMGTSGVSSRATRGLTPRVDGLGSLTSPEFGATA